MKLKFAVENLADVPEQFQSLYEQNGDKYEFAGVEGLYKQDDINRLQEALRKERNDHKAAKDKYSALNGRDVNEILAELDRIEEYKQAAGGKIDETKLTEMVEARIKGRVAPIEREKAQLTEKLAELTGQIEQFKRAEVQRKISDTVTEALRKSAGLQPTAYDDALMLAERVFEIDELGRVVTRDGVGVTPGIDPTVWLSEVKSKRPHWWGPTVGGGAAGSHTGGVSSDNPWSAKSWNMTKQAEIMRSDMERAKQMARSAGSFVGATSPNKA